MGICLTIQDARDHLLILFGFKRTSGVGHATSGPRGAQSAVVVGDPNKPGFYMVYNKWTKGNHFSRPHFHPNDRYIVVLQGTWWVGSGPKFDPANTTPMPAGSFVTHFGKQVHWDGAKDEDAVLLIMGEGPATSTAAEEK